MNKELQEKVMKIVEEGNLSYLSKLSRDSESTDAEVAQVLPYEMCAIADAKDFDAIWNEITTWESCLFVQRNLGSVLELMGKLPKGNYGHGYFNLEHGHDYCVSGHLKVDDIASIAFVSLKKEGMPSIAFFTANNETKFTIYVGLKHGEDKKMEVSESAKESFYKMKEKFAAKK